MLRALVEAVASFSSEIADVRRKIEPSGEVADNASPALAQIRDRLRQQKQRLRSTLDAFLRGRETAKYLQEQVVTDRNGRHVLMVRAEHRAAIPGIVHGGSASGASLFVEPLETVEINNDIVALEEQEAEEVRRILLALTDAFRAPARRARAHDRGRHRARRDPGARALLADDRRRRTDRSRPTARSSCKAARHPLLMRGRREARTDRNVDDDADPDPESDPSRRPADSADARPPHHRARTPAARPSR